MTTKINETDFKSLINRYEIKKQKDKDEYIWTLVSFENKDCEFIYCRTTQSMERGIKLTK